MKSICTLLVLSFFFLALGCNTGTQQTKNRVQDAREQFLAEQETGEKSVLTQQQAFLGFTLYSKQKDVKAHLIKLVNQKKLMVPYQFGNKPLESRDDLLDNASYTFNIPNLSDINTPIKFLWDGDRLKSVSGEIKAYANNWINPEIVKIFETKLGPSKSFYESDASECHYWIRGGQEILLVFPMKDNPKFIYTALAPTKEFGDEQRKSVQEKAKNDSLAAVNTSKDL